LFRIFKSPHAERGASADRAMNSGFVTPRNKPHAHFCYGYWRYRRPPLSPISARTIRELSEAVRA